MPRARASRRRCGTTAAARSSSGRCRCNRMKSTLTSSEVVRLLAQRHAEDVFVPECKGGPSWTDEHKRMDAWAMKKSWSRPLVCAYEVKVSRSDFTADRKWHAYLPYCNEFY